jgi:hypothetical protein
MNARPLLAAILLSSTYLTAPAVAQTADEQAALLGSKKEGMEASQSVEAVREPVPAEHSEPVPLPPVSSPATSGGWPDQKTVGASVMILGAASIATGLVMGIITSVKYNDLSERGCINKQCPDAGVATGDLAAAQRFEYAMMGTLLGGVGVIGAGILIHASATIPVTSRVVVRPHLGFNQLVIAGSF